MKTILRSSLAALLAGFVSISAAQADSSTYEHGYTEDQFTLALAYSDDDFDIGEANGIYDPIEPFNRGVSHVNDLLDFVLLEPLALSYEAFVPDIGRKGVGNALQNIQEPVNFLNALLQGDGSHAYVTFWRFVINSTVGIGGLVDMAGDYGSFKYRREDFGQTLGHWGVGPGPYIVLPVFGPSNLRDTLGMGVDILTNPFTYVGGDFNTGRGIASAIHYRAEALPFTQDTDANSFDPYATYRSSYLQYRAKMVDEIYTHGDRYFGSENCEL